VDEIAPKVRQVSLVPPHGFARETPAPSVSALAPGHDQADGAGPRDALLLALRNRIADIVPRAAIRSAPMPPPAANPTASGSALSPAKGRSSGGLVEAPSVCHFSPPAAPFGFGVAAIDGRLPLGGLAPHGLNEFKPATARDTGTALTLALTLAARALPQTRPVLIVLSGRAGAEHGLPYGPGLAQLGLDPARLLIAEAPRTPDALWTLEEALRSHALAAVLGLMDSGKAAIGVMPARRLVLAADEGRTPCLLLTGAGAEGLNVAHTRWRVAARPSAPHPLVATAPGARRCALTLDRCRHGPSGLAWTLEWGEGGLALAGADDGIARLTKRRRE